MKSALKKNRCKVIEIQRTTTTKYKEEIEAQIELIGCRHLLYVARFADKLKKLLEKKSTLKTEDGTTSSFKRKLDIKSGLEALVLMCHIIY